LRLKVNTSKQSYFLCIRFFIIISEKTVIFVVMFICFSLKIIIFTSVTTSFFICINNIYNFILKQVGIINSSLFNEFVCKLGLFSHKWAITTGPRVPKKAQNNHTNELNTTFFCLTSPLKAPNYLKS
jgi:hypothetical protein